MVHFKDNNLYLLDLLGLIHNTSIHDAICELVAILAYKIAKLANIFGHIWSCSINTHPLMMNYISKCSSACLLPSYVSTKFIKLAYLNENPLGRSKYLRISRHDIRHLVVILVLPLVNLLIQTSNDLLYVI